MNPTLRNKLIGAIAGGSGAIAIGDEKTGRDLAYRIAEEKHTGDGPGFKIIDMKLINDKRQNRANIGSVGVIDGIHQENHRQNHETIFRFPGVSTD